MIKKYLSTRRTSTVFWIASAAVLAGAVFAATHSPTRAGAGRSIRASASATPFDSAQAALASSQFNIQVSPLSTSAEASTAAVSEQQADAIARQHFGEAADSSDSTTLVSATDSTYVSVAADGTRTPQISDRAAWLVLIPDQQVPIMYPMGKSGPPSYGATLAALIDAHSGDFIMAAALPNS